MQTESNEYEHGTDTDRLERLRRFTDSLSLQTRGAVAGDLNLLKADALDSQDRKVLAVVEKLKVQPGVRLNSDGSIDKGAVTYAGAPKRIEDSELIDLSVELDESQIAAESIITKAHYSCLIGAAGAGKTFMVKRAMARLIYGDESMGIEPMGLRNLGGKQGPSIAICAFIGIASQVVKETLPEWLQPACKTIHSLLEYEPSEEAGRMFEPARNTTNRLDHDLIVIDEASMLGLGLWHNLLDAIKPTTRIILIGDLNQLVPVADTPFFAYALAASLDPESPWKVAELTKVHRQKGVGGNRIIETAHAVLNGKMPAFDDPKVSPDWHVIGIELPPQSDKAHRMICQVLDRLRGHTFGDSTRKTYDPYNDLVLTAGNGYQPDESGALVQQHPLNESLARIFVPETEENPAYLIDAGREVREYTVGDRVMCRKNEPHGTKDRVTNGTLGVIEKIEPNAAWNGDRMRFGTKREVESFQIQRLAEAQQAQADELAGVVQGQDTMASAFEAFAMGISNGETDMSLVNSRSDRQASHCVTVRYKNGAVRTHSTATEVEATQLAFAITTHKAQGSQAETVIIVCHQAVSRQLNREWLYTGITRAKSRVILLYTPVALRTAIGKQQIFGRSLKEKIDRYQAALGKGNHLVRLEATHTIFD